MTKILQKQFAKNYDAERLRAAVSRAAQANRVPAGDAEHLAQTVIAKLENWLNDKTEITSRELRLQTAAALANYDEDTAYLYENQNRLF